MTSFYTYEKAKVDALLADKLGTSDTAAKAAALTDAGLTAVFASTACSQHDSDIASTASGGSVTDLASLFSHKDTSDEDETSQLLNNTVLQESIELVAKNTKVDSATAADTATTATTATTADTATKAPYTLATTGSATMADHTANVYEMTGDTDLTFPDKVEGKMRDFLLILTVTTAGELALPSGVTSSGDTFSFTAGNTYIITFTEIGTKDSSAWFYVRSIEL